MKKITILHEVERNKHNQRQYKILCFCGNTKIMVRYIAIKAKSCGNCNHIKNYPKEYHAWQNMKKRCLDKDNKDYHNYGGRGIIIYPEWINDFYAFFNHVGIAPTEEHTLDRKDNNGNYEPGNLRWTDWHTQKTNQRPIQGGMKVTRLLDDIL